MSLRTQIQQAARQAFLAVGDVARAATYTAVADGAYDPATGTRAGTPVAYALSRVIVEDYKAAAVDGTNVQFGDQMVHVLVEDLDATPKRSDTVTFAGSSHLDGTWKVMNIAQDPAQVLWTLQVRR